MREIALTQGFKALVDDDDFQFLSQFKWHVSFTNKSTPYAKTGVFGRPNSFYMHRLIAGLSKHLCVDHINKNGLDNRKANLRVASKSQNGMNAKKRPFREGQIPYSTSKGVSFSARDGLWMAYGNLNGKRKYLGTFRFEQDAIIARTDWVKSNHGQYASCA